MNKLLKHFENSMSAITFAEAGETETAREILSMDRKRTGGKKALKKKKQRETFASRHDRTMEAITFAEAGEHEYARELLRKEEQERKKILVVSGDEGFSERLVNYALGMAERMKYDIVALNSIPIGKRLFSVINEKMKEELMMKADHEVKLFRNKADERNVHFTHIVKFGDPEKSIRDVNKECKRIVFVLAEPEKICEDASRKPSIPVFCLVDTQSTSMHEPAYVDGHP